MSPLLTTHSTMDRSNSSSSGSSSETPKDLSSPSNNINGGKRARASKPKVKSGCITCKRRVKCDETRPGCDRCKKSGRICDGYTTRRASKAGECLVPIQPRPESVKIYAPALLVLEDETERLYYQVFCERTASNLSGYFPSEFWHRVVLRESHAESAVRQAVIALGALTVALEGKLACQKQDTLSITHFNPSTEHHQYAITQYNKAIVSLRLILAKGSPSIHVALITCLLFVCFENLQGDHGAARSHVLCGLGLIDRWLAQNPPSDPSSPSRRRQIQNLHANEVFHLFSRIEAQSHALLSAGSYAHLNATPRLFLWNSIADLGAVEIPYIFFDLNDARHVWGFLHQRTIALDLLAEPYTTPFPPWLDAEREAAILQLQQFEDALQPLLNANEGLVPGAALVGAGPGLTVLYLNNKIAMMGLQAAPFADESLWDGFAQGYEEIVARCAVVVERLKGAAAGVKTGLFGFEIGLVTPLHVTAMKCRIPSIRRQAIRLLMAVPGREGCWDGGLLGKADAWLMRIEEESLDEFGLVPPEGRWKLRIVQNNARERSLVARAVRDDGLGVKATMTDEQWLFEGGMRETKIMW